MHGLRDLNLRQSFDWPHIVHLNYPRRSYRLASKLTEGPRNKSGEEDPVGRSLTFIGDVLLISSTV
jgi:hypothetical protein